MQFQGQALHYQKILPPRDADHRESLNVVGDTKAAAGGFCIGGRPKMADAPAVMLWDRILASIRKRAAGAVR